MPQAPSARTLPSRVRAQRTGLVEVHHRGLDPSAARQPGALERELALLRLPVLEQRATLATDVDVRVEPEQVPQARGPRPRRQHERSAGDAAGVGYHRLHLGAARLEADHLDALPDLSAGGPGALGQTADRLHGVRPAAAALVQQRLHGSLPVGPGPSQVLAAGLGAGDQLRLIPRTLVLGTDRDQVVGLGLGHRGDVADLAEAVRLGVLLEHLDGEPHQLGDRLRAVEVAHDPAGDPRRAGADAALVEHEHLGAPLGERPGDGEAVHSGADDDVGGHGRPVWI